MLIGIRKIDAQFVSTGPRYCARARDDIVSVPCYKSSSSPVEDFTFVRIVRRDSLLKSSNGYLAGIIHRVASVCPSLLRDDSTGRTLTRLVQSAGTFYAATEHHGGEREHATSEFERDGDKILRQH